MSETKRKITKLKITVADQDGILLDQIETTGYDLRRNISMNAFLTEVRSILEVEILNTSVEYEPILVSAVDVAKDIWNSIDIPARVAHLRQLGVLRPTQISANSTAPWDKLGTRVREMLTERFDRNPI